MLSSGAMVCVCPCMVLTACVSYYVCYCLTADIICKAYQDHKKDMQSKDAAMAEQVPAADAAGGTGEQGAGSGRDGPLRPFTRSQSKTGAATGQSGQQPSVTDRYAVPGGELCLTDVVLGHGESGDVLLGL